MVDQNLSSNSVLENAINKDPKMNVAATKEALFCENARMAILDELIDDCILDICFEVHRAEKIGFSIVGNTENIPTITERRSKEQITVQCYICSDKLSAEKLCSHLEVCMGISSKRKATQKIVSFSEFDSESSDSDSRPGSSKRKKKGNRGSKQSRRQGNSSSKQSSDNSLNYKDMTQDEIKSFFHQHCGVILKRSKMPCKMTYNCSRHTEAEKKLVRNDILIDMIDPVTSDEVIDVDSIDEGIGSQTQQFIMPS